MKKRLHRIYLTASIAFTLMAALAIALMITVKISDTRQNLRMILNTSKAWTMESPDDFQTLANHIAEAAAPTRATFMLSNGIVLADSAADYHGMDVHIDRPEIQAALNGKIGESLRFSDTQSLLCLYAAMQVSPVLILRLCYPLSDTLIIAGVYAAALVAMFALLYVFERRSQSRFADDIVGQMESVMRLLEGSEAAETAAFAEFQPVMNRIAYQVRRLKDDLEEISRTLNVRSNFVANASHELRSPLTSIMGFAEMIDEGLADSDEERAMCMKMIRSECDRMLEVISDILLLSKAEAQSAQDCEALDVRLLAQEVCQSLELQASRKGISLRCEGEMQLTAARKDVWEILYNLIQNGIRYGREGGWVNVTLAPGVIAVRDNGVGIAKKHLPHLFEQFYRVDETRGMGSGGTGLGLSIVRALTERCGGVIDVQSEPGEGSTFTVRFCERITDGKEGAV